jgi:hypothetical protein
MTTFILIIKAIIVLVFLLMFLRRPKLTAGVGLLTVTSAVLLDTFLGTFGREETLSQLGFFFHVINGALFAGTAIWTMGTLRPLVMASPTMPATDRPLARPIPPQENYDAETSPTAFDRQMIYDDIRHRFGPEDVLDLIFDLGITENDVISFRQEMNQLILNVVEVAIQRGQTEALALAVERILTPPPPEYLPRLKKIEAESPPTILRHYLLAHYDMAWLKQSADDLSIDWEMLGEGGKQEKVRNLLLYLIRRNRVGELIELMRGTG